MTGVGQQLRNREIPLSVAAKNFVDSERFSF